MRRLTDVEIARQLAALALAGKSLDEDAEMQRLVAELERRGHSVRKGFLY